MKTARLYNLFPSLPGVQAQERDGRLPEGEADHRPRPRLFLRPHGQARAEVPAVHTTAAGPAQGDAAG